jgi:hypothetical protein
MTLRTEVSKPSAQPEAVELVLSGDIKTTKEYRELEKQLKKRIGLFQIFVIIRNFFNNHFLFNDSWLLNTHVIDHMSVQQPRVIEKEVVVEKVPDDYENLKQSYSQLEGFTQFVFGLVDRL